MDAPFLAGDFEYVTQQHQVPLDGGRSNLPQSLVPISGNIHSADAGDVTPGHRQAHQGARAIGFGCCTFLQGRDLFQVAFQQFLECGGLGLGAGDEHAFVHLDLDGACPLLGQGTGFKGLGLQGLALFPDLCLPLVSAAFSEGCHCHTPFIRERV